MFELSSTQKKVLDIYHNEGHVKAWNYWKLMGNTYCIFLGEVPSSQFVDGESLAKHIGLTKGVICNNDTPWLKFILDGNIIYVPMKPLMHTVSLKSINVCGAVFENEGATIDIGGNTYDVTLLRGLNFIYDPNVRCHGYDIDATHDSEWNRLMYPIHSGIHINNQNTLNRSVSLALWANYSDDCLIVDYHVGNGSYSWTQEALDDGVGLVRGGGGVTNVNSAITTSTSTTRGWRPALRPINND